MENVCLHGADSLVGETGCAEYVETELCSSIDNPGRFSRVRDVSPREVLRRGLKEFKMIT